VARLGADVERHTSPSPVVDAQSQGHEGLGAALPIAVGLVAVARHRLAVDLALDVLAPHDVVDDLVDVEVVDGA
jgi:hypothetical protein